jgi:hypothetical protein
MNNGTRHGNVAREKRRNKSGERGKIEERGENEITKA